MLVWLWSRTRNFTPGSFSETKSDASWRHAMEEEMEAIEENST
jgi:hypothetical protein